METVIIHPKNKEQVNLFEQLAKVLNVPFEKKPETKLTERDKAINLYGKDFVEKIERGEKALEEGNGIVMAIGQLKALCK
jgi:hypothetical protein